MIDNLNFGEVGARAISASLAQGGRNPHRLGNMGELIVAPMHGKGYEATYRGRRFGASNQAAVATTAAMATTYTGLAIANPSTNTYNFVMDRFSYAGTVAIPTATTIGYMTGAGAAAGSLTVRNQKTGDTTGSNATASASATLGGTPVLERVLSSHGTEAVTAHGGLGPWVYDFDGSLIIPPGYFWAVYSFAAVSAAFIFSVTWEEVPV